MHIFFCLLGKSFDLPTQSLIMAFTATATATATPCYRNEIKTRLITRDVITVEAIPDRKNIFYRVLELET